MKKTVTFELLARPLDDDGSPPCSIDSKKKLRPLELERGRLTAEAKETGESSLNRTTLRPRMASWLLLRKPRGPATSGFTRQSILSVIRLYHY